MTTGAGGLAGALEALSRGEAARRENRPLDALEACRQAAELAGASPEGAAIRADALRGAGIALMSLAEWEEAASAYRGSREAARELADDRRLGLAETGLAAVAFQRGDWIAAETHYRTARTRAEAAGDARLLTQIDNNEGTLHAARGDAPRAEICFRRALARFEDLGEHPGAARAWNNLGMTLVAQTRWDEAAAAYRAAQEHCKREGQVEFSAQVLINRARLELERGSPMEAHSLAEAAWTLADRLNDGPVAAGALCLLGEVARSLGDPVGATYWFRRSLARSDRGRAPLIEAETWEQIGRLYLDRGETERAVSTWQYARHLYRGLGAVTQVDRLLDRIERHSPAPPPPTPPERMGAA
jgi:tetratricopeptide (TPR) repeat protein